MNTLGRLWKKGICICRIRIARCEGLRPRCWYESIKAEYLPVSTADQYSLGFCGFCWLWEVGGGDLLASFVRGMEEVGGRDTMRQNQEEIQGAGDANSLLYAQSDGDWGSDLELHTGMFWFEPHHIDASEAELHVSDTLHSLSSSYSS